MAAAPLSHLPPSVVDAFQKYRITGIDPNMSMVSYAKENASQLGMVRQTFLCRSMSYAKPHETPLPYAAASPHHGSVSPGWSCSTIACTCQSCITRCIDNDAFIAPFLQENDVEFLTASVRIRRSPAWW